jgi:hypothetical protein
MSKQDKKTPQEASKLFHKIIKASVSPKAAGSAEKKDKKVKPKPKKAKLPEIKGYVGVYELPSNEQLEMLQDAVNKSFNLFFKEDPTGTSKIYYCGVPVIPIDESGNVDINDMLGKIMLTYAGL